MSAFFHNIYPLCTISYVRMCVQRICAHNKFGRKGTKNILYMQIYVYIIKDGKRFLHTFRQFVVLSGNYFTMTG